MAGFLALRYYSGDKNNILHLQPDYEVRMALRSLVLMDPSAEDLSKYPRLNNREYRSFIRDHAARKQIGLVFENEEELKSMASSGSQSATTSQL